MGCTELYLSCCAELGVPETGVSGNLWSCLKEVKPFVVFDVEGMIAVEPMEGNWASSRVDLRYTNQFCVPEVTSVFFSSCDSLAGDTL